MTSTDRWQPGSQIVYREVWRESVWTAKPVTVVQDSPDLIVLYLSYGASWKYPAGRRAEFIDFLQAGVWELADATWSFGDNLILIPPDETHAVHINWARESRVLNGWYVNLQAALHRTPLGFDYMDHILDIVIEPDQTVWAWKDEAELQRAIDQGVYSLEQARQFRAEGLQAIEKMRAGSPIFDSGWEDWLPPEDWSVPVLPVGWDAVT